MLSPTLVFAFIISTLIAVIFHFLINGGTRLFFAFLVCSWVGFAGGQAFASTFGIHAGQIGDLYLLGACLGSILMILIAYILASSRLSSS